LEKNFIFNIDSFCFCLIIADELIQTSNGTTDTFLNLGARLRSPSSWPWRLITVLMVIRLLQGK